MGIMPSNRLLRILYWILELIISADINPELNAIIIEASIEDISLELYMQKDKAYTTNEKINDAFTERKKVDSIGTKI